MSRDCLKAAPDRAWHFSAAPLHICKGFTDFSVLLGEHKLKDVREKLADLARMEAGLSDLMRVCHATKGNVTCPLIASLQGGIERRVAGAE
jgi:hypothetical protein